jgi:phospholipid-binding lipoprotein MlaA
LDPLYWVDYPDKTAASIGRAVVTGLDLRSEADHTLKSLTAEATDPYATLRSAYLQNQQSLVDGDAAQLQSLPDFDNPGPAPTQGDQTAPEDAHTPP